MIKTFKPIAVLFLLITSAYQLQAQDDSNDDNPSKNENIVIRKKGPIKEKVTVVIDSNNITINGKPVDDFKSDNLDIITNDITSDLDVLGNIDVQPHIAPQVRVFSNDMMRRVKTNSAFLGVMSEKTHQGAKVTDVTKESSAEKAGLKEDDVITKIDNANIAGPDDLYKVVGQHKPDDKISITYLRNGKQQSAQAVLGKSNQMRVYSWNSPDAQFDMKNFSPYNFSYSWDKPRLGIEAQDTEDGNGVKITDIDDDDDTPATKAGLKKDDIITQVNGKAIHSVDDLKESVKDVKKGDTLKITYKRNNQTQTADVKFPKELKTIDL